MVKSEALVSPRSDRTFFVLNAILSSAAVAFIAFILLRGGSAGGPELSFLPPLNACFNALSALCLVAGFAAIRRRRVAVHRALMVTAFACSTLFLVGYLT